MRIFSQFKRTSTSRSAKLQTALYPFASFILSEETLKNYVDVAREYYRGFEERLKQSGLNYPDNPSMR